MQHYHRIRDLREDKDLTQEQLCKLLYMHKTTYTNYEQGKHTVPLDFAVTLAEFYKVSLDYIAGLTNNKNDTSKSQLCNDEQQLISEFSQLSERNKGKLEQFLENLLEQQENNISPSKTSKTRKD